MSNLISVVAAVLAVFLSAGCSKHPAESASPKDASSGVAGGGTNSSSGQNQALYDYLGNPMPAPSNMDAAFTKDGLTSAMQNAAQAASISLVKLEIDDSEFPFLVGVVCANGDDMEKLKEQIHQLPNYNYTGGVGGGASSAMNLVPPSAFPAETRRQLYHRVMLREMMLSDKINAE